MDAEAESIRSRNISYLPRFFSLLQLMRMQSAIDSRAICQQSSGERRFFLNELPSSNGRKNFFNFSVNEMISTE
jgi:hypothetical protein